MTIRMNDVRKVNVSVRQIVTTVFLIWGHFRSDYKSRRSIIKVLQYRQQYLQSGKRTWDFSLLPIINSYFTSEQQCLPMSQYFLLQIFFLFINSLASDLPRVRSISTQSDVVKLFWTEKMGNICHYTAKFHILDLSGQQFNLKVFQANSLSSLMQMAYFFYKEL